MRRSVNRHRFSWIKAITWGGGLILVTALIIGLSWMVWGFHNRQWDGQSRFTIIYLEPHLVIKSFDPKSLQGVELTFPDDLVIESISGRGSWQAGVIAKAGGAKWAADSVANYLGIAYTGVGNNFGWWDKLQWNWWSRRIDWSKIDTSKTSVLGQFTTPDGVMAHQLSSAWDSKANEWFFDQNIESQLLGIAIVNTTSTPGLGASASRVVETMGFKVRSLATADQEVQKCILQTKSELKTSIAIKKLQKTFDCKWEVGTSQDSILILGDQYRSWKTGD